MEDILLYWFPLYRHLNNKFPFKKNISQIYLKYNIYRAEKSWKYSITEINRMQQITLLKAQNKQ